MCRARRTGLWLAGASGDTRTRRITALLILLVELHCLPAWLTFSIIASMVSQAVRLRQEVQDHQQQLMAENNRLKEELRDRFRPSNIIGRSNK